jgi:hypothetical protein
MTFRTVLRQSRDVFCRNLHIYDLQVKYYNVRIRDLRTGGSRMKLKFCDLRTVKIS